MNGSATKKCLAKVAAGGNLSGDESAEVSAK